MLSLTSTPAVKCDCERQPPEASAGNDVPGAQRAVAKQRPEEVFTGGISPTLSGHFVDPASNEGGVLTEDTPEGHSAILFQPPRC
jgi:hypothetical protein